MTENEDAEMRSLGVIATIVMTMAKWTGCAPGAQP